MQSSTDVDEIREDAGTVERAKPLRGKTCVVTGSSRGIGRRIAADFGSRGVSVVVHCDTSTGEADDVAESIRSNGGEAGWARADVADYDAVAAMADDVREEFGAVDVLVNNAGVNIDKRFDHLTIDDWKRVIDVNLGGAFNCTKAFYDDLREAEHGRVINISSVVGQQGNYGQVNYAAAKSGLFGFTKSLALELAEHGTTVNCVAPGFTATRMVTAIPEPVQEKLRQRIPLNRFASVEEVVPAVRFLASDEASYITGEVINVNGGMYA